MDIEFSCCYNRFFSIKILSDRKNNNIIKLLTFLFLEQCWRYLILPKILLIPAIHHQPLRCTDHQTKGTVSVIPSDPTRKDGNVRFTAVPVKAMSDQEINVYTLENFWFSLLLLLLLLFLTINLQTKYNEL